MGEYSNWWFLTFDSGNQLIIHAMKARRSVLKLLD